MFKIEIRSSKNGSLTKSKIYQTEKSLDIWLPKMTKRWCSLGNNITVFKYIDNYWVSIPELFKESTRD
jgi:hypothetical protein